MTPRGEKYKSSHIMKIKLEKNQSPYLMIALSVLLQSSTCSVSIK